MIVGCATVFVVLGCIASAFGVLTLTKVFLADAAIFSYVYCGLFSLFTALIWIATLIWVLSNPELHYGKNLFYILSILTTYTVGYIVATLFLASSPMTGPNSITDASQTAVQLCMYISIVMTLGLMSEIPTLLLLERFVS